MAYWSNDIEEPVLVAGKMEYLMDETGTKIKNQDHWDLWHAWFDDVFEAKRWDGTVYPSKMEDSHIKDYLKTAVLFGFPLVSISSEEAVRTKVYDGLIKL